MEDLPALITARPLADVLQRRAERVGGCAGRTVALVTDGGARLAAPALADAGLQVTGLLGPDALESLAWAAAEGLPRAYADLAAVLADDVDVVAVDVPAPRSDVLLDAAVRAGLGVLLTVPRTADAERLVRVAVLAEDADLPHVVAMAWRADEALSALVSLADDGPLPPWRQVTVAGWPAGGPPRAELVDLVRRLAGEVVAVCADPAAMPAAALGEDLPVTLALLCERGTTVLVAERFGARQAASTVTLVGPAGRAVAQQDRLRLALEPGGGREAVTVDRGAARSTPSGSLRLAASALRGSGVVAASLHDLAAAARVLTAVEASRTDGGWVELG